MQMRRVLIPLDGSPLAEKALHYAEDLIRHADTITLLMVIELPPVYPLISPSPPVMVHEMKDHEVQRREAMLRGQHYLEKVAEKLDHAQINIKVVDTPYAAEAIIEAASEMQADVIAMCTHGRSGLSRWLMGSVTQKVLQAAPCPVLVVPNRVSESLDDETAQ